MTNNQHIVIVETQGDTLGKQISTLESSSNGWHLVRVRDPEAALGILSQYAVAVVVANFGSDQAASQKFFHSVIHIDPSSFRINVLSEENLETCIAPTCGLQLCITVKSTPGHVRIAIERGLSVWERARRNPRLATIVAEVEDLPTTPSTYLDITEELESPSGDIRSVAAILGKDPTLAAKVLKVANSGCFCFPRRITELHDAVSLLGIEMVQALALTVRLFDALPIPGISLDRLWRHCVTVGALARELALKKQKDRHLANTSGVAGLLHDVGQLILMCKAPEAYVSIVRQAAGDEGTLLELERAKLGVGHPELGAYLMALWGLPDNILDAITFHHDGMASDACTQQLATKFVYGAEWLLTHHQPHEGASTDDEQRQAPGLEQPAWIGEWHEELKQLADTDLMALQMSL